MEKLILVVDDEESMRLLLTDIFSSVSYKIITAANADEALALLKERDVGIIFLDLKLFGINGIELCRRIRATKPIPIIYAMTGWSALFEVAECREAGFDDYFTKPIDTETLIAAVENAAEKLSRWNRLK